MAPPQRPSNGDPVGDSEGVAAPDSGGSAPARQYTRKRQRTRARLIAAAATVLAGEGVEGATIAAIAHEAGVVPGTIYHHFGGREDLIAEVMDDMAHTLSEGLAQVGAVDDDPAMWVAVAGVGLIDRSLADRRFALAFGHLVRSVPELDGLLRRNVSTAVSAGVDVGRFVLPSSAVALAVDGLLAIAAASTLRAAAGHLDLGARGSVAELMLAMLGVERGEAERLAKEACALIDATPGGEPSAEYGNP